MPLRERADHVDRPQIGERDGAGQNFGVPQLIVADLGDGDVGELPVAGLGRFAQRGKGKQAQHHQQTNGNKTLHTEKSLLSPALRSIHMRPGFGIDCPSDGIFFLAKCMKYL